MESLNNTTHGNGTDPFSVPLIVGLSVGLPLTLFAIAALVAAIVYWCPRPTGKSKMESSANSSKTIEEYPPVSTSSYPPAPSDHIYENYQAGGASPYSGTRSQPPGNRGQRNDIHGRHSPIQMDPGDTGIYANVPSTFPRRT